MKENWMKLLFLFLFLLLLTETVLGGKGGRGKRETKEESEEKEIDSKEKEDESKEKETDVESKEKEREVEAKERIVGAPMFARRDEEAPFLLKFQINDEKNTKNCTGVQITSKHLISSANCLDFLFDVGNNKLTLLIFILESFRNQCFQMKG